MRLELTCRSNGSVITIGIEAAFLSQPDAEIFLVRQLKRIMQQLEEVERSRFNAENETIEEDTTEPGFKD